MTSGPESLRILHLVAPARVGGLERVTHALALGQHRAGHQVHVAVVLEPEEADHPFLAPLRDHGVPTHCLHLPVRAYWRERQRVAALCREIDPHIVHSQSMRTDVVDAGVARRRGKPTVTTVHGPSLLGGRAALYLWLQRQSYRWFDAVVVVSEPLASEMPRYGVAPERTHLIRNAWSGAVNPLPRAEARAALGLEPSAEVVGWVGRMIPVKGGDVFLRALAALERPGVVGVLIGDGRERAALGELARALGIADRVVFAGARDEAAPLFSAFDAFALTSRSEGIPITLFEAMAAGVPAVAARVGGVPEVLTADCGLLADAEDAEGLAAALATTLSDAGAARVRAEHARARLQSEFAIEPWITRYDAVYRRLLQEKTAPESPSERERAPHAGESTP